MNTFKHAAHMNIALRPDLLQERLEWAKKTLQHVQFDTIAFQGMSGALFAPILAREMNKYLLLVRKSGDNTHSYDRVEGYYASKQYIIVDDFTSTGDTIRRIHSEIRNSVPDAKCVGVYQYTGDYFTPDYFGDLSTAKTEETPAKIEVPLAAGGPYSTFLLPSAELASIREGMDTAASEKPFFSTVAIRTLASGFTSAVTERK